MYWFACINPYTLRNSVFWNCACSALRKDIVTLRWVLMNIILPNLPVLLRNYSIVIWVRISLSFTLVVNRKNHNRYECDRSTYNSHNSSNITRIFFVVVVRLWNGRVVRIVSSFHCELIRFLSSDDRVIYIYCYSISGRMKDSQFRQFYFENYQSRVFGVWHTFCISE